mmetsp:Transcript_2763/g.8905  ORF Transcript_2763/g.8905 Transcript_2763/m.8905 type:complete len:213 (-) Transcript_2763:599-1237(-)
MHGGRRVCVDRRRQRWVCQRPRLLHRRRPVRSVGAAAASANRSLTCCCTVAGCSLASAGGTSLAGSRGANAHPSLLTNAAAARGNASAVRRHVHGRLVLLPLVRCNCCPDHLWHLLLLRRWRAAPLWWRHCGVARRESAFVLRHQRQGILAVPPVYYHHPCVRRHGGHPARSACVVYYSLTNVYGRRTSFRAVVVLPSAARASLACRQGRWR